MRGGDDGSGKGDLLNSKVPIGGTDSLARLGMRTRQRDIDWITGLRPEKEKRRGKEKGERGGLVGSNWTDDGTWERYSLGT